METTLMQPREALAVSIKKASELTGVSPKAIRSRLDRGSIRCVLKDGQRRIPMTELYRAGLLNPDGRPAGQAEQGSAGQGHQQGNPEATFNVMELIAELTEARAEAKVKALLAQQAETLAEGERKARETMEAELHEVRSRVSELEQQLSRRRWFGLSRKRS
jgi:DNA-binding transcriptional MerR regulator